MGPTAAYQILPDGGEAPEVFHDPRHLLQYLVHVRLGVLFAEGQPQRPVGHLPMARSTWLGSNEPEVQAEPELAQMPA